MLTFRAMADRDRSAALHLLTEFFAANPFYRENQTAYGLAGAQALATALRLFVERPQFGFVWMAFDGELAVGCSIVSYAISTAVGGVVAKVEDVIVAPERRRTGVGSALVRALADELHRSRIARIDTYVHERDVAAALFYKKLGFVRLHEERLALVLTEA
ncbi:MAG: GNAT family N-acetyltransferase [Candidatus Dormibacteria bacterium]